MRHYLLITVLMVVSFFHAQGQDSAKFLHPEIWLRADQTSSDSAFWQDVSGKHHNAFLPPGQALPSRTNLNFNPCFNFTGNTGPFKVTDEFSIVSRMTVFVVYQSADSLQEKNIWSVTLDTSRSQCLTTKSIQGESFRVKYCDTVNIHPLVNTLGFTWNDATEDSTADFFQLAGADTNAFNGKLAEFLYYPDILQGRDLQTMQSYLGIKYGIALVGTDYLNSAGTVLWSHEANAEFSKGIAGIGRDTALNLQQRQSCPTGSTDLITLGAGTIDSTNQMNSYSINQGDFLVWGNNGQPAVIDYLDSALTMGLLERMWVMQVSGSTAYQIPVTMKVDLGELDMDSLTCQLVIDRNWQGFTNFNNFEFLSPDSITEDNIAWFSHIFWDPDLSGKDMFGFFLTKTNPVNPNRQTPPIAKEDIIQYNGTSGTEGGQTQESQAVNSKQPPSPVIENRYKVFPNPTLGSYDLVIDLAKSSWIRIIVRDLNQKIVKEFSGDRKQSYHFTGYLDTPGSYYVDITVDGERKVFPLIVR